MQDLFDMVWRFRNEMRAVWPTPKMLDALRYADCEAREALDAWLRLNRPEHRRKTTTEMPISSASWQIVH
ncbi:MAG: hypothetical protein GXP39_08005 [Chloroflexi bacterium]|nr:hypothetical protein [Chloroflexota bacterium]